MKQLEKIKLLNDENVSKIKLAKYRWDEIFASKELLYGIISDMLLDIENLFYYASLKESTKTLAETKKYIKNLTSKNLINSEIDSVLSAIGWEKDKIDISSTVFQGDLAELLMCILIDQLTNIETMISKVSLKTSPKVSSFGNDNIFYDFENKILYMGESKFYSSITKGLNNAVTSLSKHSSVTEIKYIKSHTRAIKAKDGTKLAELIEEFECIPTTDVEFKSIAFIVIDDLHEKVDIEKVVLRQFKNKINVLEITQSLLLIFFPVLSKKEFLVFFRERLTK